jgi:hypothetical protein
MEVGIFRHARQGMIEFTTFEIVTLGYQSNEDVSFFFFFFFLN